MIDFLEEIFIKTWKGWFLLFLTGTIVYLFLLYVREIKERKKNRERIKKHGKTKENG